MKFYFKDGRYRLTQWNPETKRLEAVSSHSTLEEALQAMGIAEEPDPEPLPDFDTDETDLLDLLN